MQLAFPIECFDEQTLLQNQQHLSNSNQTNLDNDDRYYQLELWSRLALISLNQGNYYGILQIIDSAKIELELNSDKSLYLHKTNTWLALLLFIRGMAVIGIANELYLLQQQQSVFRFHSAKNVGTNKPIEFKFEYVDLLGLNRNKSQDLTKKTNENYCDKEMKRSLFEAAEQAFYKSAE